MVHRSETTTHRTDCTLLSQRSLKKIGVGGRENHKQALDPKWSFSHSCLLHMPPPLQTQQNSTAMLLLAVPALHNIACCIPTAQPSPLQLDRSKGREQNMQLLLGLFFLSRTHTNFRCATVPGRSMLEASMQLTLL